ncbi:MAG: type II toxin-antitoxin system HicB family antitoxin [Candidatus Kuenenbacteria bacterium]
MIQNNNQNTNANISKNSKDFLEMQFPFPVFITKEKKWFVAECSFLGLATQGKNEKEVRVNMKDLIEEYLADPDTSKFDLKKFVISSLSYIPVKISEKLLYGKTSSFTSKQGN